MTTRTTHVETLRLRGAGLDDAPGLRLAASAWLSGADLHPPGLPPSAVLVVRALRDPSPGRCRRPSVGARPDAAWTQAVRSALGDAARRAARPVDGRLPPNPDAVLFADRAEWMACLALDVAMGRAAERWWWQNALRTTLPVNRSTAVAQTFAEPAHAIPAAWAHLVTWRRASDVLGALSATDAERVLRRVADACGIEVPTEWTTGREMPRGRGSTRGHAERLRDELARSGVSPLPSPVHGTLLGLALGLHRRPLSSGGLDGAWIRAWMDAARRADAEEDRIVAADEVDVDDADAVAWTVRTSSGRSAGSNGTDDADAGDVADAAGFDGREASVDTGPDPEDAARREDGASASTDARGRSGADGAERRSADGAADATPRRADDKHATGTEREAQRPAGDRQRGDPEAAEPSGHRGQYGGEMAVRKGEEILETRSMDPSDDASGAMPRGESGAPGDDEHASEAAAHAEATEPVEVGFSFRVEPEVVGTELGGVLYLINLMVRLDLLDAVAGASVGPWAVLEALARGLMGDDAERFADDGMWLILERLDDRPAETLPGEVFVRPEGVTIPASWVRDAGGVDGPLRWHASGDRVRVWSDDALLADVPADDDPQATVTALATRYAVDAVEAPNVPDPWRDAPTPPVVAPPLAWWTARVVPFVRHRLTQALGVPRDADLTTELLAVPGVVHLSSMHVDWVAPLDAASLSVRLAGLDRNPSWEPVFGRVILFHFE